MKKILLGALGVAGVLLAATSADASGGCGWNYHRGPYGGCRANRGGVVVGGPLVVGRAVAGPVVVVGVPTVGVFYPSRGYWDGRRYWAHREEWQGGWRYR